MTERYGSHHATAVYIFFDFHTHTVRMANAGHCPVLFSRKGGEFKEIKTEGSIVGFKLSSPIAKEKKFKIQNGDRFLVYTDGLTEYMSNEGGVSSYYDIEELVEGLEHLQGDELLQTAIHRVKARNDFVSFRDDVMILVIEVKNLV
jgi:serine phosphatase RsbU (regulator of sigma subunit)